MANCIGEESEPCQLLALNLQLETYLPPVVQIRFDP